MPDTMKAVVVTKTGGPEVMEVRDEPIPLPGDGEVQIEVAYAGLNFSEVYARRGQTAGFEPPFIPGLEVSGHVSAVGDGVDGLVVGTPVAALPRRGGYAEYVVCPADRVVALEGDAVDDAALREAAAVPTSVATAWLLLADAARLQPGATLLVHAAAGALGVTLASIARALGAKNVFGTVSTPAKAAYARDHGYDRVYLRGDWLDALRDDDLVGTVDVVVDSVGGATFRRSREALGPWGQIVVCGDAGWNDPEPIDRTELWFSNTAVMGFNIGQISASHPERYRAGVRASLHALSENRIQVPIARTWPMAEVRVVHAELESAKTTGKHLLQIAAASDGDTPS
jgi:NADPH:quinone reductase